MSCPFQVPTVTDFKETTAERITARRKYFREWQRAHPLTPEQKARRNIRKAEWRAANPEKVKLNAARQRATDRNKAYMQEWRKLHPKAKKPRKIKMDAAAKAASRHAFRTNNPTYFRDWKRKASADPRFVIQNRLRSRVHQVLTGYRKTASTFKMLGCGLAEFKAHIESLFSQGMTWENRRLWHLDHIRPCSSFNLLDPEQQRCCFHFTNFQPLWAADNLAKSDKIEVSHGL